MNASALTPAAVRTFEGINEARESQRKGWRGVYVAVHKGLTEQDRTVKGHYPTKAYAEWAKVAHETVRSWLTVAGLSVLLDQKGIPALAVEASGIHGKVSTAKARGVSHEALVSITADAEKALKAITAGDEAGAREALKAWADAVKVAQEAAVKAKADAEQKDDEGSKSDEAPTSLTPEEAYAAGEAVAMQGLAAMIEAVRAGAVPGQGTIPLSQAVSIIVKAYKAAHEAPKADEAPTPATVARKRTRKAPAA